MIQVTNVFAFASHKSFQGQTNLSDVTICDSRFSFSFWQYFWFKSNAFVGVLNGNIDFVLVIFTHGHCLKNGKWVQFDTYMKMKSICHFCVWYFYPCLSTSITMTSHISLSNCSLFTRFFTFFVISNTLFFRWPQQAIRNGRRMPPTRISTTCLNS